MTPAIQAGVTPADTRRTMGTTVRKKTAGERKRAILAVTRTLALSGRPGPALAAVARVLTENLDVDEAEIWALAIERGALVCVAQCSAGAPTADGAAKIGSRVALHELDDPLVRTALTDRLPVESRDHGEELRCLTPLVGTTGAIGYVELRGRVRRLTKGEVELVEIVANQLALALENLRLTRLVERLEPTDKLTGLRTTAHFRERLANEMARARRYRLPLSLLMVDLDHFAAFNQRYGTDAGDALLRAMGRFLRTGVRTRIDLVCRSGGEEFAILLPSTGLAGASILAERLRDSIGATRFRGDDEEKLGPITVSMGVASFPDHGDEDEDLLGAVRRALRGAQRAGGNRVKVHEAWR